MLFNHTAIFNFHDARSSNYYSSERMALCTILINELELYSLLGIGINCKSNPKLIRMVLVLDTAARGSI